MTVARAGGMTEIAMVAGLTQGAPYKALRPGSEPRFDTVRRVLTALGLELHVGPQEVKPAAPSPPKGRERGRARATSKVLSEAVIVGAIGIYFVERKKSKWERIAST